ncbi:unnamed protein product [Hermetia illucens]|uniref:Farnesoic acid O-methyl transferase domain-containing protein n=2 Tax=Hermetia illucens TaxID=343691 RepID=A0A7R8UIL4_HERIL|nr:unnamed protein product [Hermetia illucens]
MSKLATCNEFVTDSKECEHYFPLDYMKNYRSEKYSLYFKLYVFSYHDANLVLSNTKSGADCRVVIGGWSNTLSVLHCNGKDLDKTSIKNITSPMWPIPVVIRQTVCGWLDISIPGIAEPLLTANVGNLNFNYICLFAYGSTNRWFYNCTEEEDNFYESRSNNCTIFSEFRRIEGSQTKKQSDNCNN